MFRVGVVGLCIGLVWAAGWFWHASDDHPTLIQAFIDRRVIPGYATIFLSTLVLVIGQFIRPEPM